MQLPRNPTFLFILFYYVSGQEQMGCWSPKVCIQWIVKCTKRTMLLGNESECCCRYGEWPFRFLCRALADDSQPCSTLCCTAWKHHTDVDHTMRKSGSVHDTFCRGLRCNDIWWWENAKYNLPKLYSSLFRCNCRYGMLSYLLWVLYSVGSYSKNCWNCFVLCDTAVSLGDVVWCLMVT